MAAFPTLAPAGLLRLALPLGLICAAGSGVRAAAPAIVPIEIALRARAFAPGELARIDARSPVPLASLKGSFLGRSVSFTRTAHADGQPERWSGWAAIGLSDPAGPAILELQGRSQAGSPVAGTRAIAIESRTFPEERMTVEPRFVNPPPETQRRIDRERRRLAKIYLTRTPAAVPSAAFVSPVPGSSSSVFGTRRTFNGEARDPHSGLDLRAEEDTPVHSAGPGRVILASDLYYSGNTIIVDHGGGLFTIYAHLHSMLAREGQAVTAGELIGGSGATGRVTGPHLHWGAKVGDVPVDPRALMDPALFAPR